MRVPAFAIFEHHPFERLLSADDLWAIPCSVDEEHLGHVRPPLLRTSDSDHEKIVQAYVGAHPWLKELCWETDHTFVVALVPAEPGSPEKDIAHQKALLVERGGWIEEAVRIVHLRLEPYWELTDSTEADEAGIPDPGVQKDIQTFLDAGFEGWQMQTAHDGCTLRLEEVFVALWQIPGYMQSLRPGRWPVAAAISMTNDSRALEPPWLTVAFSSYLRSVGLGWLERPFNERGSVVDLPPGSAYVPRNVRAGYRSFAQAMLKAPLGPHALVDERIDAQPPLGRALLVPGLYPDESIVYGGWKADKVPYRSLRYAWAQVIQARERLGLSLEGAPPMPLA